MGCRDQGSLSLSKHSTTKAHCAHKGSAWGTLKAAGVFPSTSLNFGSDHIKLFGRFTLKGAVLSLKGAKLSLALCLESLES